MNIRSMLGFKSKPKKESKDWTKYEVYDAERDPVGPVTASSSSFDNNRSPSEVTASLNVGTAPVPKNGNVEGMPIVTSGNHVFSNEQLRSFPAGEPEVLIYDRKVARAIASANKNMMGSGRGLKNIFAMAARSVSSLPQRALNVGRSLADPQTRRQTAMTLLRGSAEAGLNMAGMAGVKTLAGAALVGTPLGLSIAGLALTTGTVSGLLKSHRQYRAAVDKDNRSWKSFGSHLWNNKRQLAKNIGVSTGFAAVGGIAGSWLGGLFHHAQSAAPAITDDHLHHAAKTVKRAAVAAIVPTPAPPSALDQAIEIVRKHRYLSEQTIQAAQHNDASAIREIAHAINTDHIRADDSLLPELNRLSQQAHDGLPPAVIHHAPRVPAPVHVRPKLNLNMPSIAAGAAVEEATSSTGTVLETVGAVAATGTAVAIAATQAPGAAMALSLATSRPQAVPFTATASQAATCDFTPEQPDAASCLVSKTEMDSGDRVEFVNRSTNQTYRGFLAAQPGERTSTFGFLKNVIRNSFNTLVAGTTPVTMASNDNEVVSVPASQASAPEPIALTR